MPDLLPDPDEVERLRAKMVDAAGPKMLRKYGARSYTLGFMHGWTVQSAKEHAAECTLGVCNTCSNFVSALSLFAAYSIEFPETLEYRFGNGR